MNDAHIENVNKLFKKGKIILNINYFQIKKDIKSIIIYLKINLINFICFEKDNILIFIVKINFKNYINIFIIEEIYDGIIDFI